MEEPNPLSADPLGLDTLSEQEINLLSQQETPVIQDGVKEVLHIFTALTHIMFGVPDNNIFTIIQTIMLIMNNPTLKEYSNFNIEKKEFEDNVVLLYNVTLGKKTYYGLVSPNTNIKHNEGEPPIKEIEVQPEILEKLNSQLPNTRMKIVAYSIHEHGMLCINL